MLNLKRKNRLILCHQQINIAEFSKHKNLLQFFAKRRKLFHLYCITCWKVWFIVLTRLIWPDLTDLFFCGVALHHISSSGRSVNSEHLTNCYWPSNVNANQTPSYFSFPPGCAGVNAPYLILSCWRYICCRATCTFNLCNNCGRYWSIYLLLLLATPT